MNKDIDQKAREIQTTLQIIHQEGGLSKSENELIALHSLVSMALIMAFYILFLFQ